MNNLTPHNLKTYHVFLASPGDMLEERQMVRNFFDRYNRSTANAQKLEFKVIDWETYSHTGLGAPQDLINRQTLETYKDSLVLCVGLLGQRFGTPTSLYDSGTEKEIEICKEYRLINGDLPEIKVFFRQSGNEDGAEQIKEDEQQQKVLDFMKRLQSGNPPLFTKDFLSTDKFLDIFQNDLELWLNDREKPWFQPTSNQVDRELPINTLKKYLKDCSNWKEVLDKNNNRVIHYQPDPEYTIIENGDYEKYQEPWTFRFPDKLSGGKTKYLAKYRGICLEEFYILSCDLGRFIIALPKYWHKNVNNLYYQVFYFINDSIEYLASSMLTTLEPNNCRVPLIESEFKVFETEEDAMQSIDVDFSGAMSQYIYYLYKTENNRYYKIERGREEALGVTEVNGHVSYVVESR
jgi:hypothetical protein